MATRDVVPNENGEGNIGSTIKAWLKGWFGDLHVSGSLTDGTDSVTVAEIAAGAFGGGGLGDGWDFGIWAASGATSNVMDFGGRF